MNTTNPQRENLEYLKFQLPTADDWPPVAVEEIPCTRSDKGYMALDPPIYVKDLSKGDIIVIDEGDVDSIQAWHHVFRSDHSTIWLLRLKTPNNIEHLLSELRSLGCSTGSLTNLGSHSVDVPGHVDLKQVDEILAHADPSSVAVAFPSLRHPDN